MEYGMLSGKIQTFAGIVQMLLVTASAWMFVRACSLRLSKKILAFTFLFLSVQILFLQAVSDVTVVMTTGKKGTLLARVAGHGPAQAPDSAFRTCAFSSDRYFPVVVSV